MREFNGTWVYHPSSLCDIALYQLDKYKTDGNISRLNYARRILNKLNQESILQNDARFYPYRFEYNLHNIKGEDMNVPWVSCLAQGKALSSLSRMYNLTSNEDYLERAHETFRSFTQFKSSQNQYWVSSFDQDSLLWLEEFPLEAECHTLNGMIVGIFGLYEYYHLTKNEDALDILNRSLTTLKRSMDLYEKDDFLSLYCLKHEVQNFHYHAVHIRQMTKLYLLTGDEFFKETALRLEEDFKVEEKYVIYDLGELSGN